MTIFPTRILLASDGSGDAAVAVRAAMDISAKTGSELHVVHAWQALIPPGYTANPLPAKYSSRYEREAKHLLSAQVKLIEAAGGRVAGTHPREGPVVNEILDLSEELDAGLIVAGRRGLSPLF